MIIGNGLIANAIRVCDKEDLVLFASGVSNSVNPSIADFEKEKALILKNITTDKLFVYFSTVSIHDNSINQKPYIVHKLAMEKLVMETAKAYLIFRLPNIAGNVGNPNTLFPYFKKQILHRQTVLIERYAKRYLLNKDQLVLMLSQLLQYKVKNQIVHGIVFKPNAVEDIYLTLANLLNRPRNYQLIDGGSDYQVVKDFDFVNVNLSLEQLLKTALDS